MRNFFVPGIFRLSLRQLLGPHRLGLLIFLLILTALPTLLVAIIKMAAGLSGADLWQEARDLYENFTLRFIFPIIALILSGSVLREEIGSQTIHYLLLKPISRVAIVLSKWAAAMVVALALSAAGSLSSTAIIANEAAHAGPLLMVSWFATLAYGSFFFLLSLLMDRVLIAGFSFLILWEWIVAGLSKLAGLLGIHVYAASLAQALLKSTETLTPAVPMPQSVLTLAGIIIVSLALASWRLSTMEFPGGSE
jgi:ABC-2 type transport system permease protein